MGRLNSEVMTVIKTFAVFRLMQSVVSRCIGILRYIIGRRVLPSSSSNSSPSSNKPLLDVHDFQDFAKNGVAISPSNNPHPTPPSWRGLLFVFVVTFIGLPMVVSKLFAILSRRTAALELEWSKEGAQVVALHDFEGESEQELPFRKGDILTITNKFHPDWWEASCNGRTGVIPANYVSPIGKDDEQQEEKANLNSPVK